MSDKNIDKDIEILKEAVDVLTGNATSLKLGFERTSQAIENVLKELETYKKIAEKLALFIIKIGTDETEICKHEKCLNYKTEEFPLGSCMLCIIDWARKEVEKECG